MRVKDDNGTGANEGGDEDATLTAGTTVGDAVDFIQARAAVTGRLNCTAR